MATYIKTLLEYSTGDTIYPKTKSDAVYRTDNVTVAETTLAAADTHIANTNNPHNVTATQLNVYTKTEIDNAGYLTSIPQASSSVLGGIKIGSGLTISSGGVVSVTGGGVADSVAWGHITGTLADQTDLNNILGTIPTNVSDLPNDAGYITGITSSDVTNALGYTPYSSANPNGYTSNTGTITGVSINSTSIATSGVANITSIPLSIISDASDLKAIEAISSNSGLLKKTAANTWSLDTSTYATQSYVDTAIENLPEPMIFKGSLGTGGTITSLPTASSTNTGFTYKVITSGTYASQSAKVGDTFISDGSAWVLIPSGDEPSGTVTSITIKANSPISVDSTSAITTSGTRTISHSTSGVTAGTYNNVTVNTYGHVTSGSNVSYLTSETDPVFSASAAAGITSSDIESWNTAAAGGGTITGVTAGTGLSGGGTSGTVTLNHSNSITAGTVGTSSATSGSTLAVPYVTYDAQGHITATGTHTHTVSGFLTEHQTIKQDGITGATITRYGACSVAASTAAKTVSVTSGTFALGTGARVTVKFNNANTANSPTLNVNSTGAKNIYHNGSQITSGTNKALLAGTVDFVYDGTQWQLIGNYINTQNAGTITGVSVNGTSVATSGVANITSVPLSIISDASDLKAIEALTGTSGLLKKTATNTWSLDTNTYLTSYTETDPVFSASAAYGISSSDITNWNSKTSNTGTVTKVTAGTGLKIGTASSGGDITTSGTINHINSVTAQTTQAVYPIKIDAQGHISAYGTAVTIVNTRGTATSGGTTLSVVNTGDMYTWNNKQNKATTLSGYGITDAKIESGTITLGSNTITPSTTDEKLKAASASNNTTYYPIFGTSTSDAETKFKDTIGFKYITKSTGESMITLGNGTSGASNSRYGVLELYGTTTYSTILTSGAPTAARTISLPNKSGTIALTDDIPDISNKADKATTLAGYGITDAKISNGTITLGSNTITPLTSFTEADPIFSASAAAGITSTDITNWNNKVSDDKTWNSVSLTKTSSSTAAAGYVPYVSSTSATSANYYPVAQAGSTDANAIPKYSSAGYLFAYTPSSDDNSTKVATTAFVATALSGKVSSSTTAKIFVQSSTPTGMSAGDIWIDTTGL